VDSFVNTQTVNLNFRGNIRFKDNKKQK